MFLTEFQIVIHAKLTIFDKLIVHRGHYSALKTDKVPILFGSWSEGEKNEEGKWIKKVELQQAEAFLNKYGLALSNKKIENK